MSQKLIIILSGAALALVILVGWVIFFGKYKGIKQQHVMEREDSDIDYDIEDQVDDFVWPAYNSYSGKSVSSEQSEVLDHILLDRSLSDSSYSNDCVRVTAGCMTDVFDDMFSNSR